MAVAPGKGVLAHRDQDGSVHVYVAINAPEAFITELDFSDRNAGLARLARIFDGWAPEIVDLVTGGDTDPVIRPIHALPPDHTWARTPGITLLGDAAHLMSPFAGQGANLAMLDGAELAQALLDSPHNVEEALAVYEQALFARSVTSARRAAGNLEQFFGEGAPQSVVDLFRNLPAG